MKHGVELGNTYINDKACKTFVTAIAGQLKHELSRKLQSSKFMSVMADSVWDVGVREVQDVYACHLVKGEMENSFVGLKACENSKAPGIKAAVVSAMTEVCRDWRCLALVEITNWTCGHRFSMDSWQRIYTDIISFQSWDDCMVCYSLHQQIRIYV